MPDLLKPRSKPWLVPLVLLGSGIFLYLQVFVLPATPRAAIGDQSIYLHSAARMYDGQLIYRDYDQFTLPGTDVLYLLLFEVFGVKTWIPQMMLVLVGVITVWLSIVIARKGYEWLGCFPSWVLISGPAILKLSRRHPPPVQRAFRYIRTGHCDRSQDGDPPGLRWTALGSGNLLHSIVGVRPNRLWRLFLVWGKPSQERNIADVVQERRASCARGYMATVAAFNAYFVWKVGMNHFFYYTVTFCTSTFPPLEVGSWKTYMTGWPIRS